MIDPILRDQMARDEGKSLEAYKDSKNLWTIGIGHLIDNPAKPDVWPRIARITEEECDAFFMMDLEEAIRDTIAVFTVLGVAKLDPPRYRALVNMAYNRGQTRMRESTTITPAIKLAMAGMAPWKAVSDAILASPWAKQIKSRGVRLAKQFETGIDQ